MKLFKVWQGLEFGCGFVLAFVIFREDRSWMKIAMQADWHSFFQWREAGYSALLWATCMILMPLAWGLGYIVWLPFSKLIGKGKDPEGGSSNTPGAAMALPFAIAWAYFIYLFFKAVF